MTTPESPPHFTLICATCGRRDAQVKHMLLCYGNAVIRGRRKP